MNHILVYSLLIDQFQCSIMHHSIPLWWHVNADWFYDLWLLCNVWSMPAMFCILVLIYKKILTYMYLHRLQFVRGVYFLASINLCNLNDITPSIFLIWSHVCIHCIELLWNWAVFGAWCLNIKCPNNVFFFLLVLITNADYELFVCHLQEMLCLTWCPSKAREDSTTEERLRTNHPGNKCQRYV